MKVWPNSTQATPRSRKSARSFPPDRTRVEGRDIRGGASGGRWDRPSCAACSISSAPAIHSSCGSSTGYRARSGKFRSLTEAIDIVDSSRKSTLNDANRLPGWAVLFDGRNGEHCFNGAFEVAAAVDGPYIVERGRTVGCLNHRDDQSRVRRMANRLWRSQNDHRAARPPHASLRHCRDWQRKLAFQASRMRLPRPLR